ncbi:MAG TPA: 8-oxoguanine deaminase [Opitutaceae bacterium]|jgi:cytosine/adenosine deaminase-related metal-dependent hydrolase
MPGSLLIKHAAVLATMDDRGREISDGGLFAAEGRILQVGPTAELPATADEVIDASGHVVLPGFVNTHHHMFQSLTRAVPAAQDSDLFGWLNELYPIWARLTPAMIRVSALTAMAELLLSGCTTSSDHLYLFPNGCRVDDTIEAARQIGIRFHATRGAMSVGRSHGGLPPDSLVEDEGAILLDAQRIVETHHDPRPLSLLRVGIAPCSPFSVSRDLMKEGAKLARQYGVSLHTHLAENDDDVRYSREKLGCTPAEYAEDLGWLGRDVWHAHCVKLDPAGIARFGATQTGVAHCPCSNMRLGSGVISLGAMLKHGVAVGLGVDGSASNDGGHMLAEARQAMLLQRVAHGPAALTARQALKLATRGGARVLNRDDVGQLTPGMAADVAGFDLNQPAFAGAWHDPVAALIFCGPVKAAFTVVNGKVLVRDGELRSVELGALMETHNRLAQILVA